MNIPNCILEALDSLEPADRGMAYCAVIDYIRTETDPEYEISGVAQAMFILCKQILNPILRRRKRDAANRARKRAEKNAAPQASSDHRRAAGDACRNASNNNASNSNGPTCSRTSPPAATPPLRRARARRSRALPHVATSSNRPFDVLEHVAP